MEEVTKSYAKAETIKAATLGAALFNKMVDDSENVGQGLLAIAFALSIAAVSSPSKVPKELLYEMIDMTYRMVNDADESAFDGAEKYGVQ